MTITQKVSTLEVWHYYVTAPIDFGWSFAKSIDKIETNYVKGHFDYYDKNFRDDTARKIQYNNRLQHCHEVIEAFKRAYYHNDSKYKPYKGDLQRHYRNNNTLSAEFFDDELRHEPYIITLPTECHWIVLGYCFKIDGDGTCVIATHSEYSEFIKLWLTITKSNYEFCQASIPYQHLDD